MAEQTQAKTKVLITGAAGMVGKNLLECPELNQQLNEFEILSPARKEMDLLSFENTFKYLKSNKPEIIVHCAGRVGGIQANIKNPVSFLVENWDMGRNLALAAREAGIKKLLNLATSCMYPRNAESPLQENLILQGELEPTNEGYALAKISMTKLCQYLHTEDSSLEYKTLIPCNLYGRFDKFDPQHSHMVPAVIAKIHTAHQQGLQQIDIWGDGQARREFMYTGDLANFIGFALKNFSKIPMIMNVGLGYDYSINEYYQAIAKVIGYKGEFIHDLSKPVGMKRKMVSTEEQQKLNWSPKTSLEAGIEKTYQFYLGNIL
jgi:GDP-L-fucose synthase